MRHTNLLRQNEPGHDQHRWCGIQDGYPTQLHVNNNVSRYELSEALT